MSEETDILTLVEKTSPKTPHYKDRTREERIKYCGRYMYTDRDPNTRIPFDVFEFPCGITKGDVFCQKCRERKEWKKGEVLKDRIKNTKSGTVFKVVTKDSDELRRVRRKCNYHGLEFLAVPSKGESKVVYINGDIDEAHPIHKEDAYREIDVLASLDTGKRISGSMGRNKREEDRGEIVVDGGVEVKQSYLRFRGKRPSSVEYGDAMVVASILTGWVDLNEDNIQDYITKNDRDLIFVLKKMGYDPYLTGGKEAIVDLSKLKKHLINVAVQVKVKGIGSLPIETLDKLDRYKEDVMAYARESAMKLLDMT